MEEIERIVTSVRLSVKGKAAAILLSELLGVRLSAVYELALQEMAAQRGITQPQIERRARAGVTMPQRKKQGNPRGEKQGRGKG